LLSIVELTTHRFNANFILFSNILKRILITGVNGFLGRHLVDALIKDLEENYSQPFSIIGIDNGITSIEKIKHEKVKLIQQDLIGFPFDTLEKCDLIIHMAGLASPVHYMKSPLKTIDVHTVVTRSLLDICVSWGSKFVFFSSSEIYGQPPSSFIPTPEEFNGNVSCQGPRSCYDESKRLGETLCYVYNKYYGIHTNIIRPFNIYGPGMSKYDYRMIPNMIRNYINDRPIEIFSTGKQTRTYCYYSDAIDAILKVINSGYMGETYNIGNDNPELSALDLIDIFSSVIGEKIDYKLVSYPDTYPQDEPSRRLPSIQKIKRDLSYYPKISIEEGLLRTYNLLKDDFKD